MPAAHFLGLRPGLVLAQHPDDLLLAKATPFHRPSPFQATDSTSFRLSFRGAGQILSTTIVALLSTALAGCWIYSRPDLQTGCQKTSYGLAIVWVSTQDCGVAAD